MPWVKDIDPPLTFDERHEIAVGHAITREFPDGLLVVCPRVITGPYPPDIHVTGLGITYGPNGESAFFHRGAQLQNE